MSDGAISQDEIDALLSGVDMGGLSSGGSSSNTPAIKIDIDTLSKFADGLKDTLSESLKTMTGKEVKVEKPIVESINRDQFLAKIPEVIIAVMADFSAGLSGDHLFILSTEFATKLVSLINKEDNPNLDDMALSVISEVVSQHSGSEITALSKDGKLPGLATNPPEAVNQPKAMVRMPQNKFALFTYPVTMDGTPYTMWEAVSDTVADGMAKALGGGAKQEPAATQSSGTFNAADMASMQKLAGGQPNMGMMGQQQMMPNMGVMGQQQMMPNMNTPNVQALQFPNLQMASNSPEQGNIGLIMDVQMEMTVELGRTKKTIKDILSIGEGTIIELDKLAGEPVDILVNHKPIAKGEVVVIDENFGVRVTEILPAMEHVASQS